MTPQEIANAPAEILAELLALETRANNLATALRNRGGESKARALRTQISEARRAARSLAEFASA